MDNKQDYNALKKKYDLLENKYDKLNSRMNSMMKMNDKNMKSIFDKNISAERSNKRFNIIMKQSDKQSKDLLIKTEAQEEMLQEQSKMASMGKMIENISHQMKQPLSLIMTSATAMELQKELNMLSDDEFVKYTTKIISSSEYLNDTIDNFRDFFQDDKIKQRINLIEIIVKSRQLLESKFKGSNIKIIHDLSDIVFMGISNELIQVITNLLSNSIDAMENMKKDKFIFIRSLIQKDIVLITITDSGGGIPSDIIGKIFDAHFTTKGQDKGSGIGLDMSKMIIENTFNGTMNVKNRIFDYENLSLKGACFTIVLPFYEN